MGKKSNIRHEAKPAFRESDFAGRPPQEQASLSGSLNQLSQQIAESRKLLKSMDTGAGEERLQLFADPENTETTGSA